MAEVVPTQLQRTDDRKLIIVWSDGFQQTLACRVLRESCQCASCMNEKTQAGELPPGTLPVLTPAQARPLEIVAMKPVGNYAYNIEFSDGHSTGIFTFEMLRSLDGDSSV